MLSFSFHLAWLGPASCRLSGLTSTEAWLYDGASTVSESALALSTVRTGTVQ